MELLHWRRIHSHQSHPEGSSQAVLLLTLLFSTYNCLRGGVHFYQKPCFPRVCVCTLVGVVLMCYHDYVICFTWMRSWFYNVSQGTQADHLKEYKKLQSGNVYRWLKQRRVKAFYNVTTAPSFRHGVQGIMQVIAYNSLKLPYSYCQLSPWCGFLLIWIINYVTSNMISTIISTLSTWSSWWLQVY